MPDDLGDDEPYDLGDDEPSGLQEVTARIAGELSDARLVPIEGSGHVTYAEAPDVFARAVAAFAHERADAATTR